MTLIQYLLIMVQTNFPFVLSIKGMTLLSNHYNLSHLNLLLLFKQNSKHLIKRTTKLSTNNLFYSMTLILQVMTKIIYILEFQNLILLFQQTQPYKKIILLFKNHRLILQKKVPLQKMYKLTLHLSHIVHKLYLSMILPSLNTKIIFKAFSYLMTTH